ncbi:hypothetical protein GIB67_034022 [Kingdonia uniflora]|uniref:Uncharacterized protein n=1 Tax=Kingdonia uniflora TaxID=39325 RepID=A0A7J7M632_9MAGN|nr:hypothetical protein GIB67_034022 [Kingdonia uniflora]
MINEAMGDVIDLSGDRGVMKTIIRQAKVNADSPSENFPLVDARLEARVVTEDSKKFIGNGLEMKHLEETTKREVYRVIDLVGEKDREMSKSSRSKDNEEVVTLIQGVHMINDSNHQEAQSNKTNPNLKPIPRVEQIEEWGFAELFGSDEQNYGIEEEVISDCKEMPVFE